MAKTASIVVPFCSDKSEQLRKRTVKSSNARYRQSNIIQSPRLLASELARRLIIQVRLIKLILNVVNYLLGIIYHSLQSFFFSL